MTPPNHNEDSNLPVKDNFANYEGNEPTVVAYEATVFRPIEKGRQTIIGGTPDKTRTFVMKCRRHRAKNDDRLTIVEEGDAYYPRFAEQLEMGDERLL